MRSIEDVMKDLIQALNELELEYVIVGGMAVNCWGNIRTTKDIDVIIDLKEKDIENFVKKIKKRGFIIRVEDIKKAVDEKSHFTVFDREYIYHIDIKGVYGERERKSLEEKKEIKIDDLKIFVASPEDVIANKLLFGSEQDIKDAESIFIRQKGKLNIAYLEKRCKELNVYEEYKKMVERIKRYLKNE